LKARFATAAALGLIVVGGVLYLPAAVTGMLLGVFLVAGGWEWTALIGWSRPVARISYAVLIGILAILVWHSNETGQVLPYLNLLAIAWWLIAAIFVVAAQLQRLGPFIGLVSNGACGLVVLLPAWSGIVWLLENDRAMLLSLFALIWIADGGAYFVGKRWGRRRLASNVSPGKTWEGVAGGLGLGATTAVVISYAVVLSNAAQIAFIVIAIATICVSIVGDLFESMLKRHIGVKDSSQLLPGHGGVMDRIDGLVAASPIFVGGLHYWVYRL
jgi:phosphatidate cytidylyltransferase